MTDSGGGETKPVSELTDAEVRAMADGDLRRIAHMFIPYRDDTIMRELCRLAVKCAQEGWTRG